MQYYLITKWFGSFLLDSQKNIVEQSLFSKDEHTLLNKIKSIRDQRILNEEKKLADKHNPIVIEKRLQSLGSFQINNSFFSTVQITFESFGFSKELLHSVLLKISKEHVDSSLSSPDYQIIQQVNALDELQHIANVLSERLTAWNMYSSDEDNQKPIVTVLQQVEKNQELLKQQIETDVKDLAPNMTELIGPMIAARLLSHAGSLKKLAMLPASSIQLLGAEKALFRFKKQGGRPPKHGVIFQHPSIGKAPFRLRGKHARLLSAKLCIAAKADMFTKRFIASDLKKELEENLKK
jgi:nucleolar protein 56